MKRFWKWFKLPVHESETRVEVTKDYFSDNDEYINEQNGWCKLEANYIEVMVNEEK